MGWEGLSIGVMEMSNAVRNLGFKGDIRKVFRELDKDDMINGLRAQAAAGGPIWNRNLSKIVAFGIL